jgi:hypothetical protein
MKRRRDILLQRILLTVLLGGFGLAHMFAIYKLDAVQRVASPTLPVIAGSID